MSNTTYIPQHIKNKVQEEAEKVYPQTGWGVYAKSDYLKGAEFLYSLLPSPGVKEIKSNEDEIQEWREECERLAKVAEYWQTEYNKLKGTYSVPKIDNL